jgi:hypothetical protein
MDNSETLLTLDKQDTWQKQKKTQENSKAQRTKQMSNSDIAKKPRVNQSGREG